MTFRIVRTLIASALLLGLAWLVWDPGKTTRVEEPQDAARNEEVEPHRAVAGTATETPKTAPRDDLLHAPRFQGRILDDRGLGYPEVEIQLCGVQMPLEVLTSGRSDASGRFQLQPLRSACSHRYRLRARVEEGFPWVQSEVMDPQVAGVIEAKPLLVPRPAQVEGRIVDPENQPLAGIEILFVAAGTRGILGEERLGPKARSGPRGQFRLRLPAGTPYRARLVNQDRYQAPPGKPRRFRPGPNAFVLRVGLLPHSELEFHYWTWTRRPHPGVLSQITPEEDPAFVRLEARASQPLPSILMKKRIHIPETGRVDVFMPPGARLALQPRPLLPGTTSVQVRFEYQGRTQEKPGSRSPAHPLSGPRTGRIEVPLTRGQVRLQELQPGRWRFWVQAPGWPESGPVEIQLEDRGPRPVREVPLVGPAELAGSLLDAHDQPLTAHLLRLYSVKGNTIPGAQAPTRAPVTGWLAQIRTDSHGRFHFLGLPLGAYQLWLRARDGKEALLAEGRLLPDPSSPLRLIQHK